jgi:hypothetical protein
MLTFIDRFSAPDLMMRYHWGLGVGHYHAHQPTSISHHNITSRSNLEPDMEGTSYSSMGPLGDSNDDLEYTSDDPELGLEYRHLPDEGWQDMDTDGDPLGDSNDDLEYISDDPELGLEDRHLPDEGWQDMDTDGTSDGDEDIEEEDYTGL